ncbi:MAG: hypothetical protein AAF889_11520, partial [Cyanobacteria bacterium P01_D01_bin.73]
FSKRNLDFNPEAAGFGAIATEAATETVTESKTESTAETSEANAATNGNGKVADVTEAAEVETNDS